MIKHRLDDPLRAIYKDVIQPMIGTFFEVEPIFSSNRDVQEESEWKERRCLESLFSDHLCSFECDGCGEGIVSLGDFDGKTRISVVVLVEREE